jgi:hypothetical protein|tara:strand:- start:4671 stop:5303 length:633 start_codon:yes stop_codon:yes gene_type:complete
MMLNNTNMMNFKNYLTESAKQYDYKIKVAGPISDDFSNRLETALGKFEVSKMSAGKTYPIQETPLDFPQISNMEVTIFDATTNYPCSTHAMQEYLADYMNMPSNQVVVRRPGEPTEEYQDQMKAATQSEYKNKLMDLEYKDSPKVKGEDFHSTKANMSLLKELLKDREENKDAPKEKENIMSKEEESKPSPVQAAHKGPVKGNPDPAGAR